MKLYVNQLFIVFLIFMGKTMYAQSETLIDLLPDIPVGWKEIPSYSVYTPETLYDYIDGGAELYISYGMTKVISKQYKHDTYGDIRVEIFDMDVDRNAFGVFTHTRTKDERIYGQGSQYFTGAQIFWKGRYFVSVIADDENEEIRHAIRALSRDIDSKISESGKIPEIVELLPLENKVKDGFIYFHHYIWLNSYYFLSNENIFDIDEHCQAVLCKYDIENTMHYVLLIQYDTEEKASEAMLIFNQEFIREKTTDNKIQIEDKSWLSGLKYDNYFIAVFNAKSNNTATQLMNSITDNLNVK